MQCRMVPKMALSIQSKAAFFLAAVIVVFLSAKPIKKLAVKSDDLTYVITETGGPESFDPIFADSTQNLPSMRMLYLTPLEAGAANGLESSVLSSFKYDEQANRISFIVRSGLKFSDGQDIEAMDVALAIARVGYKRPTFPVIKDIKGIHPWSASAKGLGTLPSGIVVEGNKIEIQLVQSTANPLFRFCLELFSIIPRSCINLEDASLVCERPPASGHFEIQSQSKSEIVFRVRNGIGAPHFKSSLKTIKFKFKKLSDICAAELAQNEVVAASELDYINSSCKSESVGSRLHWLPSARFLILRFNPQEPIFSDSANRRFFASKVREQLELSSPGLDVQRGLFPILLPGYLEATHFESPISDVTSRFSGKRIAIPSGPTSVAQILTAIAEAARNLGMKVDVAEPMSIGSITDEFVAGRLPVTVGGSGFWAQDPIGDLSMWFTKGLHKAMVFTWQDEKIYEQIGALERETDPVRLRIKMETLNRHLDAESLIAPVVHYRRLFISNRNSKEINIPQAITSPAPWQLVSSD